MTIPPKSEPKIFVFGDAYNPNNVQNLDFGLQEYAFASILAHRIKLVMKSDIPKIFQNLVFGFDFIPAFCPPEKTAYIQ